VKEKAARIMKELTEEDFQYCLEQWKFRMERCRDRAGVYFYKTTLQRTIYNSNEGFVVLEELSEGPSENHEISNKDFFERAEDVLSLRENSGPVPHPKSSVRADSVSS
jgi:hypothetical protein